MRNASPLFLQDIARTLTSALAAVLLAGSAGAQQEPPAAPASLYEKATAASLEVLVEDHLAGTAVLVESNGLILTAAHVVGRPGARVEVLSPAAGRRTARVIAVDGGHDLALLSVEPRPEGYPGLQVSRQPPAAGTDVYLLGTPIYRHAVMLRGMMARNDETFEYYGDRYVGIVHVSAMTPAGTSGGPWLNPDGEIVGIQSGMMTVNGAAVGVAYMVPHRAIQALLESKKTAATPTAGMAVEETWQQQRDILDRFPPQTEGLVVKLLNPDGPAVRAGIQQGVVIVAADGQKVRLPDELQRIVLAKSPGDSLSLTLVLPDGAGTRQATVQLGKLEVGWPVPQ